MNEFKRYVILIICIASCAISVLLGLMQMIEDKRDQAGFNEVKWDTPKVPYYRGGGAYRAPSSQGSTIPMPRVSSSSQQLFHHNAGGTYAGQGTGTYRSSYAQSTGRPVHTFSNGGIYSYGGGGGSGGASGVTANRKASNSGGSAGYSMPSISISMPRARSYAYNNVQEASSETSARQGMPGRRKVAPDRTGELGEVAPDTEEEGKWWYWDWDEEEWTDVIPIGATRYDNSGNQYTYTESGWVQVGNQAEPDSPIGDVPWMLLLLMAGGYAVVKSVRWKMYEQE